MMSFVVIVCSYYLLVDSSTFLFLDSSCFLYFVCIRRNLLEKKLADADVSEEDQNNQLKFLEKKETVYMRLQRHKMGADDFELLTMIGKGAFGEVKIYKRIVLA